jgi:TolB-like protein
MHAATTPTPVRLVSDGGLVLVALDWSGDPSAETIGRTIAESLVHALSTFRDLRVLGPSTAGSDDPREIGREFGVRFVLQGGVVARGSQVRLYARLSDARSGWTVWSCADTMASASFVAFDVEDRWATVVAARVADATGALHARVGTSDVIHGTGDWTESDLRAVERLAREVLAADPRRAEAHIALGDVAALRQEHVLATRCADQAVDLAPCHPTVLMAAGTIHCVCGDWARGEELMRESFRLGPEQPDALHALPALARLLADDPQGALLEADLIHSTDQPWGPLYRALSHARLGDLPRAWPEMEAALVLDPGLLDDPLARFRASRVRWTVGQLEVLSGFFAPFLDTHEVRGAVDER